MDNTLLRLVGGFALIFSRVLSLFTVSPVFGRRNLVTFAKIILSVLVSYIVLPTVLPTFGAVTDNLIMYALMVTKEVIIGLIIGYVTTLIFSAPYVAGQVIDMQIGFGMVNIYDPSANAQVPLTGSLLNIVMLLLFFYLDGQLILIRILTETFISIPVGTASFEPNVYLTILKCFAQMLVFAVQISMPVIGIMAIAELCLGIIVRAVPQMNVFVVGIPLKIFLGVIAIFLLMPVYMGYLAGVFDTMYSMIEVVFEHLIVPAV